MARKQRSKGPGTRKVSGPSLLALRQQRSDAARRGWVTRRVNAEVRRMRRVASSARRFNRAFAFAVWRATNAAGTPCDRPVRLRGNGDIYLRVRLRPWVYAGDLQTSQQAREMSIQASRIARSYRDGQSWLEYQRAKKGGNQPHSKRSGRFRKFRTAETPAGSHHWHTIAAVHPFINNGENRDSAIEKANMETPSDSPGVVGLSSQTVDRDPINLDTRTREFFGYFDRYYGQRGSFAYEIRLWFGDLTHFTERGYYAQKDEKRKQEETAERERKRNEKSRKVRKRSRR